MAVTATNSKESPGARLTAAAGAKEHCNNAHFSAAVGSRQV
jgi:hypothetical protein